MQDDGAWYFACYVSLLNPGKFSRTWTFEDEDKDKDEDLNSKDKDLKIGPRGSSRTRTFLEDNNTGTGLSATAGLSCLKHSVVVTSDSQNQLSA